MLPEKNRLKGRLNFEEVKASGRMHQSENFGMLVLDRNDKNPTRFGFIVSTRISKKAVDRNKIKRMLRDAVRKSLDELANGYDVLFLARKGLLKTEQDEVNKEVAKSIEGTKLI